MEAGTWIAGYAAIVSTLVAVQQWRRDRLRVAVSFATSPGELTVRVANVGNRPIFLDYVAITVSPRSRRIVVYPIGPSEFRADRAPAALEAGQRVERRLSAADLRAHVAEGRRWIDVTDATGRSYNKRISNDTIDRVLRSPT